jgi:aryl-alcohol dehydrogenase-like predicted oxidoreductase
MEYRQLGRSGFKVPVLSFGTGGVGINPQMAHAVCRLDAIQAAREKHRKAAETIHESGRLCSSRR